MRPTLYYIGLSVISFLPGINLLPLFFRNIGVLIIGVPENIYDILDATFTFQSYIGDLRVPGVIVIGCLVLGVEAHKNQEGGVLFKIITRSIFIYPNTRDGDSQVQVIVGDIINQ